MTAQLEVHEHPDARLPQPGEVVAGKYRIDAFIARGGMGAVLAATHQVTGRRMALKWLLHDPEQDAEATHRLVREARAAARVRHPNVVDVYDVGEHDGALFLVMELLEGDTLHARLHQHGALDPRTTLAWLLPVLRGVEAAHQSGVIHRDLKPSNIFLCREPGISEPIPRVLDFGISKIASAAGDGEQSLTRTGAVLGTPHYMAPEQLTGEHADARADVYALGVILYQCLTGRQPFQDRNYNALVLQIAHATPVAIAELAPHVPSGLSAVVMRAMARERAARFASVEALIDALLPFGSEAASHANARERTHERKPWLLAALMVGTLAAGVAVWLSWQRDADSARAGSAAPHAEAAAPTPAGPSPASPAPTTPRAQPVVPSAAPTSPAALPAPQSTTSTAPERTRRRGRAQKHAATEAADNGADSAPPNRPVAISTEQF